MIAEARKTTSAGVALRLAEVIFHTAVRSIRKTHGNALVALFLNMMQTLVLVLVFYAVFGIFGIRGTSIRGDFLLYIMTGVFLFMCHIKAISAVLGAEGPGSPIMKHAPMNTLISVMAAALGALYIQVLSLFVVLFVYHVGVNRIEVHDPVGAMGMVLVSWFSGVGIGMMFMALKPWLPGFVQLSSQVYMRANMLASGKMFVANMMPGFMLVYFTWNPLFHAIDQARGFTFVNYVPMHSSPTYPLWVAIAGLVIGLMGEFYTRQHASLSWQAGR